MALARCVYCGKDYEDYTGTYLITNDGIMHYYCSMKCRKNKLKLGRDRRNLKWTTAFYESRDKRYAAEKKAKDKADAAQSPEIAIAAKKKRAK